MPIQLDVTDQDAGFAALKQANDHLGRLDIVVNNAGCRQLGSSPKRPSRMRAIRSKQVVWQSVVEQAHG